MVMREGGIIATRGVEAQPRDISSKEGNSNCPLTNRRINTHLLHRMGARPLFSLI